jgi:hypothetical protein
LKIKAQFTLGVKANVKLKSNISIGAKVETSPKGFTQGIKVETFFLKICPKFMLNFMALYWPQG